MRRRARHRSAAVRTCFACALAATVGLYLLTLRVTISVAFDDLMIGATYGGVVARWPTPAPRSTEGEFLRLLWRDRSGVRWRPVSWRSTISASGMIFVPLWMPLVPLAGATLWVFLARRAGPECCGACGYDRSGLPAAAPCPECGTQPKP